MNMFSIYKVGCGCNVISLQKLEQSLFYLIVFHFILFHFFSLPPSQGLLFTVHLSGRLGHGSVFISVGLGVQFCLKEERI